MRLLGNVPYLPRDIVLVKYKSAGSHRLGKALASLWTTKHTYVLGTICRTRKVSEGSLIMTQALGSTSECIVTSACAMLEYSLGEVEKGKAQQNLNWLAAGGGTRIGVSSSWSCGEGGDVLGKQGL